MLFSNRALGLAPVVGTKTYFFLVLLLSTQCSLLPVERVWSQFFWKSASMKIVMSLVIFFKCETFTCPYKHFSLFLFVCEALYIHISVRVSGVTYLYKLSLNSHLSALGKWSVFKSRQLVYTYTQLHYIKDLLFQIYKLSTQSPFIPIRRIRI